MSETGLLDLRGPSQAADQHRDRALVEQLDRITRLHPHYRAAFADQGVDLTSISSIADLVRVPLTTKTAFAGDPESFVMEPGNDADVMWDVVYTTGSSGLPVPVRQTAHDFRGILMAQRRMADIRGLGPTDTVANLFPFADRPNGSWLRVTQGSLAIGARVVAGMSGPANLSFSPTRRLGEVMELLRVSQPTVLWGVPTYVRRLLREFADSGERLPAVRMVAVSGEGLSRTAEDELVKLMELVCEAGALVSKGLGATELQCSFVECQAGSGYHNPAPELFLAQAVDERGTPVPDGEPGALCLTHLDRRATALVRYLVGDMVTIDNQRCPHCGRLGERITAHLGRMDGRVKVRGTLIDLVAVAAAVDGVDGVVDHQLQFEGGTGPDDAQQLTVRCAVSADAGDLAETVQSRVRAATSLTPRVLLVSIDELFDDHDSPKPKRSVWRQQ